jgi:hypothetical protein
VLAQWARGGVRSSDGAGASWAEQRQGEVGQRLPNARESGRQAWERCEELLGGGGWCAAEPAKGRVAEQDESEASEGKGEARRSRSMRKQEQARWRNEQRGRAAWAIDGIDWQDRL